MRPEMIDKIREWYILAIGAAVLIGGVAIASYQPGNVPGQAPASEVAQRQAELSKPPSTRQAAATRPESKTAQSSDTSASEAHNHAGASVATAETGQTAPMPPSPERAGAAQPSAAETGPRGGGASTDVSQDLRPKRSRSHLYRSPALGIPAWGGRSIVNAKPAIPWNQARTRLAQASRGFSAGKLDRSPITTTRRRSRTRQLSGISQRSMLI